MTRAFQMLAAGVFLLGLESILPSASVPAQENRGTATQRAACRPDVYRLCAGEIPNVKAITRCLERNRSRLSPACSEVFAEAGK